MVENFPTYVSKYMRGKNLMEGKAKIKGFLSEAVQYESRKWITNRYGAE